MVRTQIYLTQAERDGLVAIAEATGKKHSEIIREAIDRVIALSGKKRRIAVLDAAAGMWSNRADIPDSRAARKEWDRR